jgi:hypothetical protein
MTERSEPYELSETETAVMSRVAANMRAVGLLMGVYGVAFVLMGMVGSVSAPAELEPWAALVQGGLFLVLSVWTWRTGTSFRPATTAKENNRGRLMAAMDRLHGLYRMQKWLLILGVLLWMAVCVGTFLLFYVVPKFQQRFFAA